MGLQAGSNVSVPNMVSRPNKVSLPNKVARGYDLTFNPAGAGSGVDNLLLETGDNLLLETDDVLLLE